MVDCSSTCFVTIIPTSKKSTLPVLASSEWIQSRICYARGRLWIFHSLFLLPSPLKTRRTSRTRSCSMMAQRLLSLSPRWRILSLPHRSFPLLPTVFRLFCLLSSSSTPKLHMSMTGNITRDILVNTMESIASCSSHMLINAKRIGVFLCQISPRLGLTCVSRASSCPVTSHTLSFAHPLRTHLQLLIPLLSLLAWSISIGTVFPLSSRHWLTPIPTVKRSVASRASTLTPSSLLMNIGP